MRAQYGIIRAEQAVNRAEERDAENLAVYEHTMAIRHLQKAREEAGWGDFGDSVKMSLSAGTWADQAIITIEREGRDVDLDEPKLTDAPDPVPPATPAPVTPAPTPAPAPAPEPIPVIVPVPAPAPTSPPTPPPGAP